MKINVVPKCLSVLKIAAKVLNVAAHVIEETSFVLMLVPVTQVKMQNA